MLKISENPPLIPESVKSLTELCDTWWVGHTKSRFEKAFAWDLSARGIGYFLPMSPRVTFSGGRKRTTMTPVFPSYVFFCGDQNARYEALATNRLCQVLPVVEQGDLIRQLSQIETVLRSGQTLDLYPTLPVGSRVRITDGPFRNFEGVLVNRDKPARFVLKIDVLGQGASLDIDSDLLEPADDEGPQEIERQS